MPQRIVKEHPRSTCNKDFSNESRRRSIGDLKARIFDGLVTNVGTNSSLRYSLPSLLQCPVLTTRIALGSQLIVRVADTEGHCALNFFVQCWNHHCGTLSQFLVEDRQSDLTIAIGHRASLITMHCYLLCLQPSLII